MRRAVAVVVLLALCMALGAIDRATITLELPKYRQDYEKTFARYFWRLTAGLVVGTASLFATNPDGTVNTPVLLGGMAVGAGLCLWAVQPAFSMISVKEKMSRCEYVDAFYDSLDPRDADAIWRGVLYLGMPADIVEVIRGKPIRVNSSVGAWGRHEQWVYSSGYLYFEDGRLSSMQY